MMKLKKIEEQIQEITFFLSVIIAFSLFLSGIFYLTLTLESLTYILGTFGAALQDSLFTGFGYAYFYLAVMALHLGYVANFHIYSFKDIKREYPVLAYSAIGHLIILSLFASAISIVQIYLDVPARESLTYGSGGLAGLSMGGALYQGIGVYGSLIIIAMIISFTAVLADFVNLPDIFNGARKASKLTTEGTIKSIKSINRSMTHGMQFLLKENEMVEATPGSSKGTRKWISQASHLVTDHFHIYGEEAPKSKKTVQVKTSVKKTTKTLPKKTNIKKKASAKKKVTAKKITAKGASVKKTTTRKKKAKKKTSSRRK